MIGAPDSLRRSSVAGLALATAFAVGVLLPVRSSLELSGTPVAGSGVSARLVWSADNLFGSPVPFFPWPTRVRLVAGGAQLRIVGPSERLGGPARLEVALQAAGEAGMAEVELQAGPLFSRRRSLAVVASEPDRDADGLPDAAELVEARDREAFRRWFTAIAEAQFYRPDPRWSGVNRDCAGLVRFAYQEALRSHDRGWLARVPYLHQATHPEILRFAYPQVPLLGSRLFRQRPGVFDPAQPVNEAFSASASARALWEFNTLFVSREPAAAETGDLLFFRDPENHRSPMHTMVLLDPPADGWQRRVVYHTGGGANGDPGEVRLVRLADLNAHRDEHWHVRPDNPHFLGFYRWKILEGGRS